MPLKLPQYCHRKRAKGRSYYYFDTGTKTPQGKPILTRLPDYASNGFGRAYAACLEARENRGQGNSELTIAKLVQDFQRSPHFRNKAENTQISYEIYLRKIVELMGETPADEVERRDVTAMQNKLADKPAAANQTVRTMSALFKWAVDDGILKDNPAKGITMFDGGEHEPWPDWVLDQALKAEDPLVRLATQLLYYTAQRIGDVCAMRWEHIQPDGTLFVKQAKTKTELYIPIHSQLAATLKGMPRGLTTIISQPNGKPMRRMSILNRLQAFASERGVKIVAHGLRKNAVNALLEAGCSAAETSAISGQSLQMVEHYAKRRNKAKLARRAMSQWDKA